MSLISVNHLTFYYEGSPDYIFDDVSFQIDTDWKLGFVARNGRGKTTFMKLLMGIYEYRGSITTNVPFDYFPYLVNHTKCNTLEVVEEICPDYEFWMLCRELSYLEVDADVLYRPFETLSNGERTKVMLAVLFSKEHSFLLIDEPTNHLDVEARTIVRDYLSKKKGFILVSHDRDFLDQCIDHVLAINKTNIEVFQGNFSTWWENRQRQEAWEKAENERLKKEIGRLTDSVREKGKWADDVESKKIGHKNTINRKDLESRDYIGEKSRRMQMRRKNLERRKQGEIEEKASLLKNQETVEDLRLYPLQHYKDTLAELENVRIYYDQPDRSRKYLKEMNFRIEKGEFVVLQGRNGSGKSSILKAILQNCCDSGLTPPDKITYEGKITTASGMILSYVSQDTSFLRGNLMEYAKARKLDLTLFLTLVRKLDFNREQFEKPMENYSEGQKKKVLIAGSLCEQAHLYIWDEPLNFIDVFSRMQIEQLLIKYRPTMLLVEHDKVFVDKLGAKVISCV